MKGTRREFGVNGLSHETHMHLIQHTGKRLVLFTPQTSHILGLWELGTQRRESWLGHQNMIVYFLQRQLCMNVQGVCDVSIINPGAINDPVCFQSGSIGEHSDYRRSAGGTLITAQVKGHWNQEDDFPLSHSQHGGPEARLRLRWT